MVITSSYSAKGIQWDTYRFFVCSGIFYTAQAFILTHCLDYSRLKTSCECKSIVVCFGASPIYHKSLKKLQGLTSKQVLRK